MCDPVSMMAGQSTVNNALGLMDIYSQGSRQAESLRQQAGSLDRQRALVNQQTALQAGAKRRQAGKDLAKNRVVQAARGGTLTGASNMAVAADRAADYELDALVTEWQGANEEARLRHEGSLKRRQIGQVRQDMRTNLVRSHLSNNLNAVKGMVSF